MKLFAIVSAVMLGTFAQSIPPREYVLGPDDQLVVRALDAEEIGTTPLRIDSKGEINLPLVGRLKAAGMTPESLEKEIEKLLQKYLNEPDVSVYVAEMRTAPVSVLGAVQSPGVQRIQGRRTLFEVLSAAGGLRADAGHQVLITRKIEYGDLPLQGSGKDSTGQFSIGSVDVKKIMDASSPTDNILVKPEDVISVPKADVVYVIGTVKKPGGFVLGENRTLSGLQILALAEGLDRFAKPENARILRAVSGSQNRLEILLDLKKIIAGKAPDIELYSDDILFVPNNPKKAAMARTAEAAFQVGTMAVYRIP